MRVEFLDRFLRDLDKLRDKTVKSSVRKVIESVEHANNFRSVANTKKLIGHKSAYRIRVGDYRIGLFVENDLVEFARIEHRKDIYDIFP